MNKDELIDMLFCIKDNAYITRLDGKPATIIDDCKLDSFLWVIEEAIEMIQKVYDEKIQYLQDSLEYQKKQTERLCREKEKTL